MLAYAEVAIAAFGWGTWSLFLRPSGIDARWSSALVLSMVAIAGSPTLLRRGAIGAPDGAARRPIEWLWVVALGVSDAGNAAMFFAAMNRTTVAIAVLTHYLAPVFVALAAPRLFGTPRGRGTVTLSFVALAGLALVLRPWSLARGAGLGDTLVGALLGAGSAVFYAANVLLNKAMSRRFTSEETLVYHSVVSGVVLAALALAQGAPLGDPAGLTRVALGGAIVGAGGGLSFLYGLRHMPAEHAGMLCFIEPLVAVLAAWWAFAERPHPIAALGGAIVVAAGLYAIAAAPTEEPPASTSTPA
jgi:drug/metabolite transporter (DMT)-like permease